MTATQTQIAAFRQIQAELVLKEFYNNDKTKMAKAKKLVDKYIEAYPDDWTKKLKDFVVTQTLKQCLNKPYIK